MNENRLTDRKIWSRYWNNKQLDACVVPRDLVFSDLFEKIFSGKNINSFIEIGGFPGVYSVFVKKYFALKQTDFLDFVSEEAVLERLLDANGLEKGDVIMREEDLFNHQISSKYDLVFSNGFIEHFNDTEEVLQKHKDLLSEKGVVFVLLPNFRGLNGWFQKLFDRDNYKIHNIDCMNITYLKEVVEKIDLEVVEAGYYGKFSIWLENYSSKNILFKFFFKLTWFIGKIISKILPFETKSFSPYIYMIARMK